MSAVLDSIIEVATPENIAFRYQVAGPFRRCPAWAVDVLIRAALLLLLLFGLSWVASIGREWSSLGLAIGLVVWFLAEWFYGGLFETYWNGQTPGKRWMRLRVLSADGRPIHGLQAVLRNILRSVDLMPVVGLPFVMDEPLANHPDGLCGDGLHDWHSTFPTFGGYRLRHDRSGGGTGPHPRGGPRCSRHGHQTGEGNPGCFSSQPHASAGLGTVLGSTSILVDCSEARDRSACGGKC